LCRCYAHTISDAHARYHTNDPDTSVDAAANLTTGESDKIKLLDIHVGQLLRLGVDGYTGLTHAEADEIGAFDPSNSGSGARKRGTELRDSGFLYDTLERRINPGSGRPNAVWKLTGGGAKEYCRVHGITPSGPLATFIAREDQRREQPQWHEAKQGALWD
jgi:hypothetical protein